MNDKLIGVSIERLQRIIAEAKATADAKPEQRERIADEVMPFFAELRRREMEELKTQYEEKKHDPKYIS